MSSTKKNFIISLSLLLVFVIYIILVKNIDLKGIGPEGSIVGFSSLNGFVFGLTGENMIFYYLTEVLGIIPIFMAFVYAIIGFNQLVKRKSLFKVDRELLGLGAFYMIVIGLYVFFEIFIVNYRPVLMDGELEASFPSSHTLIALCICGSAILLNKKKYNKLKITRIVNKVLLAVMILLVVGRILSGVHWFSDILGGLIISLALLMGYYTFLEFGKEKRNV